MGPAVMAQLRKSWSATVALRTESRWEAETEREWWEWKKMGWEVGAYRGVGAGQGCGSRAGVREPCRDVGAEQGCRSQQGSGSRARV